jgi:hypothetical protein
MRHLGVNPRFKVRSFMPFVSNLYQVFITIYQGVEQRYSRIWPRTQLEPTTRHAEELRTSSLIKTRLYTEWADVRVRGCKHKLLPAISQCY